MKTWGKGSYSGVTWIPGPYTVTVGDPPNVGRIDLPPLPPGYIDDRVRRHEVARLEETIAQLMAQMLDLERRVRALEPHSFTVAPPALRPEDV